jgi:hypothetical protein
MFNHLTLTFFAAWSGFYLIFYLIFKQERVKVDGKVEQERIWGREKNHLPLNLRNISATTTVSINAFCFTRTYTSIKLHGKPFLSLQRLLNTASTTTTAQVTPSRFSQAPRLLCIQQLTQYRNKSMSRPSFGFDILLHCAISGHITDGSFLVLQHPCLR